MKIPILTRNQFFTIVNYPNKYKQWSENERAFIKANYLFMTNRQLSCSLGRTEDSVRKELNKFKLKRPRKSDLPKTQSKRGRKRKINSVLESINVGLQHKRRHELDIVKAKEREKQIVSEAVWAANFTNKEKPIERQNLINPVVISVPEQRLNIQIDSSLPASRIIKKISAVQERYGADKTSVSNFKL